MRGLDGEMRVRVRKLLASERPLFADRSSGDGVREGASSPIAVAALSSRRAPAREASAALSSSVRFDIVPYKLCSDASCRT